MTSRRRRCRLVEAVVLGLDLPQCEPSLYPTIGTVNVAQFENATSGFSDDARAVGAAKES